MNILTATLWKFRQNEERFQRNTLHTKFVINMLFKNLLAITTVLVLWRISLFFLRYCTPLPCCGYDILKNDCGSDVRLIKHLSSWFVWCMDTEMAHTVIRDLHLRTFGLSFCCSRCRPCMLDNVCSVFRGKMAFAQKVQHSRCIPEVFIFLSLTLDPRSVPPAKNIYFLLTARTGKTNLHHFVKSKRSLEN